MILQRRISIACVPRDEAAGPFLGHNERPRDTLGGPNAQCEKVGPEITATFGLSALFS